MTAVRGAVHHDIGRVTLLTNPMSGHGNARHAAERAIARFQQRGVDVCEIVGRDAAHARQLVDEELSKGTDALVVAGGDGVISLALQALARGTIPLGIIPAGTGNDHAREYGLPTGDPEAAADIVVGGWAEVVDLGQIDRPGAGPSWFGTVMAAGFDSLVSDRTNRMSWPHGRMRYNVAMVAEMSKLRLLPFQLTFDDGAPQRTALTLAAFGNTRSYGGGMLICPGADHADGLLDVTMVHSASRAKLIRLFPTVLRGTHINLAEVSTARAKSVQVDCPGINAYADGDLVGPLPVTVSAVSKALRILRSITSTTP
jgi:diacylglycerol kinase (ATP)